MFLLWFLKIFTFVPVLFQLNASISVSQPTDFVYAKVSFVFLYFPIATILSMQFLMATHFINIQFLIVNSQSANGHFAMSSNRRHQEIQMQKSMIWWHWSVLRQLTKPLLLLVKSMLTFPSCFPSKVSTMTLVWFCCLHALNHDCICAYTDIYKYIHHKVKYIQQQELWHDKHSSIIN